MVRQTPAELGDGHMAASVGAGPAGAFTPGPWYIECEPYPHVRSVAHGCVFANDYTPEANARLISAAPELLEQCQEARDFLSATHQNLTNGEWDDYGAMMLDADLAAAVSRALGANVTDPGRTPL